jgi:K+ transporter
MKFIKENWFSILLVAILIFILLYSQKQNELLVKQVKEIEALNKNLVKQSEIYLNQIDSLSNIDVVIVTEIEYIKIKEDEDTAAVDTMSVSELQGYFSGRYEK